MHYFYETAHLLGLVIKVEFLAVLTKIWELRVQVLMFRGGSDGKAEGR